MKLQGELAGRHAERSTGSTTSPGVGPPPLDLTQPATGGGEAGNIMSNLPRGVSFHCAIIMRF